MRDLVRACALLLLVQACSAWLDPPPASEFLRRKGPMAVVVDRYVYVDGGFVFGSGFDKGKAWMIPANDTLSIDLSRSWDPSDATFLRTSVSKDKPTMYRGSLVADASTGSFYLWGGRRWDGPPARQMWRFMPDGRGNGSWSPEATTGIDDIVRTESSASTTARGVAYFFGGSVNMQTDKTSDILAANGVESPGYRTYNFSSRAWANHTADVPEAVRRTYASSAFYMPSFGPNGLIALLGGTTRTNSAPSLDFGTLHLMDPVTRRWYAQKTTGTAPAGRSDHCAVGVAGDNGTYEIFIYGGTGKNEVDDEGKSPTLGDVAVLSLPGFVWHNVPATTEGELRTQHACVAVGKRQMLSVGGVNVTNGKSMMTDPDQRAQGLGVFDLTELRWTDRYDAGAAAYATPEVLKKWYTDGGLDKVQWSEGVESLFRKPENSGNDTSSPEKSGTPESPPSSSGLSPGAIAGIAVGSAAGLAAMAALVFFLLRRRQDAEPSTTASPDVESPYAKLDGSTPSSTWGSSRALSSEPTATEMYSSHPELGGDTQRVAMRDSLLVPGQIPADRRVEMSAEERAEMVG